MSVLAIKDRETNKVSATVVQSTDAPTLRSFVEGVTKPSALVVTDDAAAYVGINRTHERMINTLAEVGIDADELFLLGGIEKRRVLDILKPHIFFDDQIGHLGPASASTPCVHVPFGIANYGA